MALPGGGWTPLDPLGIDRLALLSSDGGELLQHAAGSWSSAGAFGATVDPTVNVIEGTLPEALLPPLGGSWRAFAVLGIRQGASSWLDGTLPIQDLAFVGGEPPWEGTWQNTRQGELLAGALASGNAAALVDLDRMAAAQTELAQTTAAGFHTFLYRSELDLPEGIRVVSDSTSGFHYGGPYQPYLVWLPGVALSSPTPLVVFLHGASGTHLASASAFENYPEPPPGVGPSDPFGVVPGTGQFDFNAPVVMPLGRGELNFFFGTSERDVFDVLADAQARFDIDEDRIVLSGISMGGVGTWRLGVLHPDRWSFLIPIISPSNYIENTSPQSEAGAHWQPAQLETLHNLPVSAVMGRLDPLERATLGSDLDVINLTNLGIEFRYH